MLYSYAYSVRRTLGEVSLPYVGIVRIYLNLLHHDHTLVCVYI